MLLPLGLFAIAALAGLIMALRIFAGATPPWALSLAHAAFGAAGLITLYFAAQTSGQALANVALIILTAAALGGFFLASFHLRGKPHPKLIIGVHALAAVAGVGLLAAIALNFV